MPDVGQPPSAGNLVPSTRPSMPQDRGTSQFSTAVQGGNTPTSELLAPPPVSTPPEAHEDVYFDPQVAALQAMFPDMDVSILQSVLEASGGNHDQAIETLLTMNDPDYKPPAHAVQPQVRTYSYPRRSRARPLTDVVRRQTKMTSMNNLLGDCTWKIKRRSKLMNDALPLDGVISPDKTLLLDRAQLLPQR